MNSGLSFEKLTMDAVFSLLFSKELCIIVAIAVAMAIGKFVFFKTRDALSKKLFKSIITNILLAYLNILFAVFVYFSIGFLQKTYDQIGLPSISTEVWSDFSLVTLLLISVVAKDFADYWNHRAMHTKWIWPIHAIHHSDEDMNGTTTLRVHILEGIFMKASYIILLSWLGLPAEAGALGALALTLHNAYVHSGFEWNHGPLEYLIASPNFHKWHHADVPEAYGKNLANVIPLFDLLFGTYYNPKICREETGVKGLVGDDPVKLVLFPFLEWYRMIKRIQFRKRMDDKATEQEHTFV